MTRTREKNAEDLAAAAASADAKVSYPQGDLRVYRVRNKGEFADFLVEPGQNETASGRPNGWVTVTIRSSYGTWSHQWTSIGDRDWREFLASVDLDYAMGKFMGMGLQVEDLEGTVANLREFIDELRQFRAISPDEADRLIETHCDDSHEDVRHLMDALGQEPLPAIEGYWELATTRRHPGAEAFWRELWLPFAAQLEADLDHEMNGPREISWEDPDLSDDDPGIQQAISEAARRAARAAFSELGLPADDSTTSRMGLEALEEILGGTLWEARAAAREQAHHMEDMTP